MRKDKFLEIVLSRLENYGLSRDELLKQRRLLSSYLTSLGIGEESEELDAESAEELADRTIEIIEAKNPKIDEENDKSDAFCPENAAPEWLSGEPSEQENECENFKDSENGQSEEELQLKGGETELTTEDIWDADEVYEEDSVEVVKVFETAPKKNEEAESFMTVTFDSPAASSDDAYDEFDSYDEYYGEEAEEEVGATIEFDALEALDGLDGGEYDSDEDEEDYYDGDFSRPAGNPVFFWILAVILSPVLIAVSAVIFALIPVCFVGLLLFLVLYIPLLILLILGGSVASIAELIYSIIKLTGGEMSVGLFELGLGFLLFAFVLASSVLVYRLGTKYVPAALKKYPKTVKKCFRRLKRLVYKAMEVCSI